jgi:hypothetical protein
MCDRPPGVAQFRNREIDSAADYFNIEGKMFVWAKPPLLLILGFAACSAQEPVSIL